MGEKSKMANYFSKRSKIEEVAKSAVKLTKAGENYSTVGVDELEKLINDNSKLVHNEFIGASKNPKLTSKMISDIFSRLNKESSDEKNNSPTKSTNTKNAGLREKIRRILTEHPNIGDELKQKLLLRAHLGVNNILANPTLTDNDLQSFFDNVVLLKGGSYEYDNFNKLIGAKNIKPELLLKWYKELTKFADWEYNTYKWHLVISNLLQSELCPIDILKDVASAPNDGKEGWKSFSEGLRDTAVEHKNANDEIKALAYLTTKNIKYLPQTLKDIFLY